MAAELNGPIKCACGNELPKEPEHAAEHPLECCDCYDIGWGAPPPVHLDRIQVVSLYDHDKYDDDFDKD